MESPIEVAELTGAPVDPPFVEWEIVVVERAVFPLLVDCTPVVECEVVVCPLVPVVPCVAVDCEVVVCPLVPVVPESKTIAVHVVPLNNRVVSTVIFEKGFTITGVESLVIKSSHEYREAELLSD